MLDFPASPSVGQKYPASPIVGIPTYTWDGEKWTTQGGSIVSASPGTLLPLMNAKPALVGVSTNFSREDHVHPVDTSRASFDAMAYSGLQINGGMEVSQENGTNSVSASGTIKHIIDGWKLQTGGAQVLTGRQNSPGPAGFNNCLQAFVTTANPSPAAGNYCIFLQYIEGYRVARLSWGSANAQPITFAFWVQATRPGNYSGAIANGAFDRSYPFTFTINVTNTWEYKVITIPGDTIGTWAKDNTAGLAISIAMMAGSTFTAPAGGWAAGTFFGANGTTNCVAATTDGMLITGFILLPGNEAPSAARSPFVMRSYDQELQICKRYWQLVMPETRSGAFTASAFFGNTYSFSEMRAQPTITQVAAGISSNASAYTFVALSNKEGRTSLTSAAAGDCYVLSRTYSLDARL